MIKKFANVILLNFLVSKYFKKIGKRVIFLLNNSYKQNVVKINKTKIIQIYDEYNLSYVNERSIEIPLTKHLVKNSLNKINNPKILEIGNTLIHYENEKNKIKRLILDKYEVFPGVINEDIKDFNPKTKFDLIFSISTLEHVGSDYEEEKEEVKFIESINQCLNLLKIGGTFIVTLPIFYRDVVDDFIFNYKNFDETYFLQRKNFRNDWFLTKKNEIIRNKRNLIYNSNYPNANALFIGIIKRKD